MNQGFFHFIIFVVSCAFTQEVLNLKLESDNSVPIGGGNLTLSCLMDALFTYGIIHWLNPEGIGLYKCFSSKGGWCTMYTSNKSINTDNYSFTANSSGAYAYINGLDRIRDGGTWKCMYCHGNTCENATIKIVIYTSPVGVNLIQTFPEDGDLGVKSITLMCQTVACTYLAPNINWFYKTDGQIAPFIGFPSYTNISTSQCLQQEAIYTSILHLPRGTNFSGNIPLTTKFLCGITHQSLGEEIRYSNISNDVIFAVHVSKVILQDSENGTKVCYEGILQTLKCVSSPARPVPIIQWFLQTNNATNATTFIANITEMNKYNNDGLHVKESEITIIPKRDQIYTIHCAGNIDGQQAVNSTIVDIDVLYAPEINVTVSGSDQLHMTWNVTCEASGFPTNYTFHPWKQMLGEVTIRSDLQGNHEGIINSSKNILTLNRLSLQDIGTYVCSVDNGVRGVNGDIIQSSATVLNVKGTPEIVNRTNVTFTGDVGSSANIYIAFYSDPVVTEFKFQRNGSKVENTSRTRTYLSRNVVEVLLHNKNVNLTVLMAHLLINNLTDDDFDDYNLVLENSLGKTDFKVLLNRSGPPLMVATFYYNRFTEGGIEFHFDPGYNGGRNQSFVIEYSSVTSLVWDKTGITDLQEDQTEYRLPNGTYFVTVTKPSPGDYIYRIYSKNSNGRSPYSMNVSVFIPQDKQHSIENPLVPVVVGSIVTAMVVILGVAATRILMKKGIFSTKKSSGACQSRKHICSLRDDIGAVYENMPVLNANVNIDNEYVNALAVGQFGADVHDDNESVYENRNDVDLSLLRNNGDLIYADLELAIPKENNGKPIIHGLQNRTEYAEIAFDKRGEPLPNSDDEKE